MPLAAKKIFKDHQELNTTNIIKLLNDECKKKHTLLLIDDKPANLISLKSMLENENREIITCLSASEGLQYIKRKISLILVDVQMPEMDGYEFV
jgi:response regulator RpfG family c-di-GMP phosphodiesterase